MTGRQLGLPRSHSRPSPSGYTPQSKPYNFSGRLFLCSRVAGKRGLEAQVCICTLTYSQREFSYPVTEAERRHFWSKLNGKTGV
jgi:hypothetical protein